jgi:hypothetical protein
MTAPRQRCPARCADEHAAYSGLRLPWFGNSFDPANRFYVTFLAILAAERFAW